MGLRSGGDLLGALVLGTDVSSVQGYEKGLDTLGFDFEVNDIPSLHALTFLCESVEGFAFGCASLPVLHHGGAFSLCYVC